ncbi:MAG: hypothetical protein AB7R69_01380 [Candidatus Babeliales bacterium]
MNQFFKALLGCLLIAGTAQASLPVFGKTFYHQRSQGANLARWLSGQAHHVHLCDTDCVNGSWFIAPYYGQTYNDKELGSWFFFNGTNTMRFGPQGVQGVDVFARNFFLNDDFDGAVTANPRVKNFVVDINFFLGLDEWVRGLYFRIDVPVNWTSWDMKLTQTTTTPGTIIAANTLGNDIDRSSPLNNIIAAWKGDTLAPTDFPDLKQKMRFARIDGKQTKASVADITFMLGYDIICNECSHWGVYVNVVAPTGTRPDGQFVFEPVVGNGRYVEMGPGTSGHFELWNNGCDQSFGIFFQGYVNHMFRSKQKRTFDLKQNGIGSRYLLIKRFDPSSGDYANEVLFGPNVLTRNCRVKNDIQGEGAFMFDYQNCGFTFDVGYDIWGRTKDKITITETIPANTFGVQGTTLTGNPVVIGSTDMTQSQATIANPNNGPIDKVFITTEDLNIESAEHPGAVSHKIFTHIAYTWENCDYLPFIGIGGEVEFSGRENRAFDQWGIWIKGGFTFF